MDHAFVMTPEDSGFTCSSNHFTLIFSIAETYHDNVVITKTSM